MCTIIREWRHHLWVNLTIESHVHSGVSEWPILWITIGAVWHRLNDTTNWCKISPIARTLFRCTCVPACSLVFHPVCLSFSKNLTGRGKQDGLTFPRINSSFPPPFDQNKKKKDDQEQEMTESSSTSSNNLNVEDACWCSMTDKWTCAMQLLQTEADMQGCRVRDLINNGHFCFYLKFKLRKICKTSS